MPKTSPEQVTRSSSGTTTLRRVGIRGAGVTLLAGGTTQILQIAGTFALARMLSPADFGVVTAVTTLSVFLASIGQVGIPEAIIQREAVSNHELSILFWVNLITTTTLSVAFAGCGPLIASFYNDPRLSRVTLAISLSILFTGTTAIHLGLLNRTLRFSAVSINNFASRAMAMAVAVLLAWRGWGYWALVAGVVAQPLFSTVGAWIQCRWVPAFPRSTGEVGSLLRFAINVNGRWNVNYCTRNLDNVLIAWRFGASELGSYKKAYDLFVLPANQLFSTFPVAVATLSRLAENPAEYRRYLGGAISALALLGMGLAGGLTLVGADLIRVVLGSGWETAGRIFTFLSPGIGVMLIYSATGIIHLSLGTSGRWFRWTLVELIVTGSLFVLALPWGPVAVATAWTVSFWLLLVPGYAYAGRPVQLEVSPMVRTTCKCSAASLFAVAVSVIITRKFMAAGPMEHWTGTLVRNFFVLCVFGTVYLAGVVVAWQGYAPVRQFAAVLKEMMPSVYGCSHE